MHNASQRDRSARASLISRSRSDGTYSDTRQNFRQRNFLGAAGVHPIFYSSERQLESSYSFVCTIYRTTIPAGSRSFPLHRGRSRSGERRSDRCGDRRRSARQGPTDTMREHGRKGGSTEESKDTGGREGGRTRFSVTCDSWPCPAW